MHTTIATTDTLTELRKLAERVMALLERLDPGDTLPPLNDREKELLEALEQHGQIVRGYKTLAKLVAGRGAWAGASMESVRPIYANLARKRPHLLIERRGFYGLRNVDPLLG